MNLWFLMWGSGSNFLEISFRHIDRKCLAVCVLYFWVLLLQKHSLGSTAFNSTSSVTKTRGHYYCQYVRLLVSRVLRSPRLSTFKSRRQYFQPLDWNIIDKLGPLFDYCIVPSNAIFVLIAYLSSEGSVETVQSYQMIVQPKTIVMDHLSHVQR